MRFHLADRGAEHNILFLVGHALYVKLVHGGRAKNDRLDAQKIARRLRLAQVLELVPLEAVSRRGTQVRGPCPVHGSTRSRSRVFAAHLERHCWHGFRCGAHGNAVDLWLAVTKQSVYAGALDLCRRLGLEVPWLLRSSGSGCRPAPSRRPPRL